MLASFDSEAEAASEAGSEEADTFQQASSLDPSMRHARAPKSAPYGHILEVPLY
jgi:hypothetical protein